MIVDSSALIAVAYREPGFEAYERKLVEAHARFVSAATLVECMVVVIRRSGVAGPAIVRKIIESYAVDVIEFTASHAELASHAFFRYGKGMHPARLNFGDCFSYALAKSFGQPLLFKGDDFAQTDIPSA